MRGGRVECATALIGFNGASYPIGAFPKPSKRPAKVAEGAKAEGDMLEQAIHESVPKGERSHVVFFVVNEMLRRGYCAGAIVRVLLDHGNAISEHVYDQSKPPEYAARQVRQATEKIEFICDDGMKKLPVPANVRIALLKLGVSLRHDEFADRILLTGLPGFGPTLEDAAINRLWLLFKERLRFSMSLDVVHIVLNDTARLNGFHPVREYLDGLAWDGKPRVDKWLSTYAGAEDSKYARAVGALVLVAAVRRIRPRRRPERKTPPTETGRACSSSSPNPPQYERLSTVHTTELYNPHKVPENWFERYAEQTTFYDCCRGYEGFEPESWIKPTNENKKPRLNENEKLRLVEPLQPGARHSPSWRSCGPAGRGC